VANYTELLDILHEDAQTLAVNKPAGWASAHDPGDGHTVDTLAKMYLKEKYAKPGNVYLGVVHRLDKPTTGVLLFARTSKAAARLCEQFRSSAIEKAYWAVVTETAPNKLLDTPWGTLDDTLWHNDAAHRVEVVPDGTPSGKPARTHYTVKARHKRLALLELRPHTGRKHQLRVQLASRGLPIYGDRAYGGVQNFGHAIALHARSLAFLHPTLGEPITLTANVPQLWRGPFAYLLHA